MPLKITVEVDGRRVAARSRRLWERAKPKLEIVFCLLVIIACGAIAGWLKTRPF